MSNQNAITTAPNENSLVTYMRSEAVVQRFSEVLGNDARAGAFISSVLVTVAQSDRLSQCTLPSIMASAMRAATMRLSCDVSTGHAWLIPYKVKGKLTCTFQPGYKGILHMALRTNQYRYINVSAIHEGIVVEENLITGMHTYSGARTCGR